MEISGAAVLRRSLIFTACRGRGFTDEGHLQYYVSPVRCGGKKEEKRRAKIVKELSKDLSAFYSIGFGVEAGGTAAEIKGKMMTEAADLLMSQLKQLKSEKKELKRKKKEQKAAMKAARMKDRTCDDNSSSSSESSCSECETVVRINNLRKANIAETQVVVGTVPIVTESCCSTVLQSNPTLPVATENCCGTVLQTNPTLPVATESCCVAVLQSTPIAEIPMKRCSAPVEDRIEVCMGGKCKKSGAIELMAEFEKMVGEGAVVGCKCMGKCRDGPNVRVSKAKVEEDIGDVRVPRNPLCIGVGLEDVGAIVANFFGEEKGAGLLPA